VSVASTYNHLQGVISQGNCNFPDSAVDPNFYAAIDGNTSNDYQHGMACGACAALHDTGNGNSVTVMIVDDCTTCSWAHQIDLGPNAWNALTNNAAPGIANINWNFVPCPLSLMGGNTTGNIEYQWYTGCSANYAPIQFVDMLFPITAVSYGTGSAGPFTPLALGANSVGGDEYWMTSTGNLNSTTGPFYFVLTDGPGQSVTIGPLTVGSCGVTNGTGAQFNGCGPTNTPIPPTPSPTTYTDTPTCTPTVSPVPTNTVPPAITNTATNTPTPTSTWSFTPAVTPSGCAFFPPYPNPVHGAPGLSFGVLGTGKINLTWKIFTIALVKVAEGTQTLNGSGTLTWNLQSNHGTPVANGLYYLELSSTGSQNGHNIFKILVLR
jgi:hypothetical protein